MDFFQKLAVALTVWTIIFLIASFITGIEEMKYGSTTNGYANRKKVWHVMIFLAFMCGLSSTFLFICA